MKIAPPNRTDVSRFCQRDVGNTISFGREPNAKALFRTRNGEHAHILDRNRHPSPLPAPGSSVRSSLSIIRSTSTAVTATGSILSVATVTVVIPLRVKGLILNITRPHGTLAWLEIDHLLATKCPVPVRASLAIPEILIGLQVRKKRTQLAEQSSFPAIRRRSHLLDFITNPSRNSLQRSLTALLISIGKSTRLKLSVLGILHFSQEFIPLLRIEVTESNKVTKTGKAVQSLLLCCDHHARLTDQRHLARHAFRHSYPEANMAKINILPLGKNRILEQIREQFSLSQVVLGVQVGGIATLQEMRKPVTSIMLINFKKILTFTRLNMHRQGSPN